MSGVMGLARKATALMIIVVFFMVTGCASTGSNYAVNINGVPVKDDKESYALYAGPGVPTEKEWHQKPAGIAALIVFGGLAGWMIYEVLNDPDDPGGMTMIKPLPPN